MKIQEPAEQLQATACLKGELFEAGTLAQTLLTVAAEHTVEIMVNGSHWKNVVCSPCQLAELVLGRLCTEGRITCAADVEQLIFTPDGRRADVTLAPNAGRSERQADTPVPEFKPEWLLALEQALDEGYPLYSQTHGSHSCTLMQNGRVLAVCEDLSRHNALDKAVGWAIRHEVELADCLLYSSGRAPQDMLEKVAKAGVRLFVCKAVPTAHGAAFAKQHGIKLICCARGGSRYIVL